MYRFQFTGKGLGQIQIDDFVESFESALTYWSKSDYQRHWAEAGERLKREQTACFITSITEPKNSNFIRSWICYPIGGGLVFQDQMFFLDQLEGPFDESCPHKHVPAYESFTEDGDRISEWRTNA